MKKVILSLALVLVVSLLVSACSTSTSTTPATTAATSTATTTKPATTSGATTTQPATTTTGATTTTKPATTIATTAAGGPVSGGKVTIMTGVLPDGIFGYPPELVNGASIRVAGHVLEGLIEMTSDGSLVPCLAETWTVPADQTSITFNIRKGVKFMDDTDLNADAVKWNFDNMIAAKKVPFWKSVEVLDAYTLKVNFTSYSNTILQNFADVAGFIVSPTAFKTHGKEWMYLNICSTAAFSISKFNRDVSVTMVKNPNYWQKGKPYLDSVEYQFLTDSNTAWAFMQKGGADVWWTSAQWISQAVKMNYDYVSSPGATMCLIPDSANAESPWSNIKVRQAAEYAIDREGIAKAFGYGLAPTPYQVPAKGSQAYIDNFAGRKYNVEKAKQLLADAGFPKGFDTTLICQISSNTNKDEVLAIQAYLQAIGIRAQVQYYETAKYYEYRNGTWKNACLLEPIAIYANYNSAFNYYFGEKATVFFSLEKSPAFKTALKTTMSSAFPDAALMRATTQVMFDQAMVIPTSQAVTFWLLQPKSKIKDLGLLERHSALYMNSENAWISK